VQAEYAPPSKRHSNVDPVSVDVKLNAASLLLTVPEGPSVMVVFGGVRSTLNAHVSGVSSWSVPDTAATAKVCWPSSTVVMNGDVQAANGFPSRLHTNVAPAGLDENVNRTAATLPTALGFSLRVVFGRAPDPASGWLPDDR